MTKQCSKCKQLLSEDEFTKGRIGCLHSKCKTCMKTHRRTTEYKACREAWEEKNYDKIKADRKARKQTSTYKARQKSRYEKNKNKIRIRQNIRHQTPEWKARMKDYYEKNKNKIKINMHIYRKNRMKTDPIFCLIHGLRTQLCLRLRLYTNAGKVKTSSEYGINYRKIIDYLKPTIDKLKSYHKDHIISSPYFNLNDESQIRIYHSAENLQWLSPNENSEKNDNIREEDITELKRRLNEDSNKLDINILNHLLKLSENSLQINSI